MRLGIHCRYEKLLSDEYLKRIKQKKIKLIEIHGIPEEVDQRDLEFLKNKFEYSLHASVKDLKSVGEDNLVS